MGDTISTITVILFLIAFIVAIIYFVKSHIQKKRGLNNSKSKLIAWISTAVMVVSFIVTGETAPQTPVEETQIEAEAITEDDADTSTEIVSRSMGSSTVSEATTDDLDSSGTTDTVRIIDDSEPKETEVTKEEPTTATTVDNTTTTEPEEKVSEPEPATTTETVEAAPAEPEAPKVEEPPAEEPKVEEPAPVSVKVSGQDRNVSLAPGTMVWKSQTGSKFHTHNDCGNMNPDKAQQITVEQAVQLGLEACDKCY